MADKRKIDHSHPDYVQYREQCDVLLSDYQAQVEQIEREGRKQYPDWHGRDTPWGTQENEALQVFFRRLNALQERYKYLFIQDGGT